jgi:aldehyde:ferredoxin oxidoreductase
MLGGYVKKLARVNLSTEEVTYETKNEDLLKRFIGGVGLSAKIMWDEVPAGVHVFDPENRIIFMTGPLTGTGAPGANMISVVSKSPVRVGGRAIGGSEAQGYFGPELKFAGFDGIIVEGRAKKAVYLYAHDDKVEIRDAGRLWGCDTYETDDRIKSELGDRKVRTAVIGPYGESTQGNMGCIKVDRIHAAGRNGLGNVMGSKRLKAVVARGTREINIKNREAFRKKCEEWVRLSSDNILTKMIRDSGTAGTIMTFEATGMLPVNNFSGRAFPDADKLTGEYAQSISTTFKQVNCRNCHLAHNREIEFKKDKCGGRYEKFPEYECIAALGPNCGIGDLVKISQAAELCEKYGLDGISTGDVVAFAMECYEKGIITKNETDGIELRFGNADGLLSMIEKIGKYEGFGRVLAGDVREAASRIGRGSEKFVVDVKGMGYYANDSRSGIGHGLAHAVAPYSHHGQAMLAPELVRHSFELGIDLDPRTIQGKAEVTRIEMNKHVMMDSFGYCLFAILGVPIPLLMQTASAAIGWEIDVEDANTFADRVTNLMRAFNVRHGLTPIDDRLPERMVKEPRTEGPAAGVVVNLEPMLEEYYDLMKWDRKSGRPLKRELERLGLEDVARELWD